MADYGGGGVAVYRQRWKSRCLGCVVIMLIGHGNGHFKARQASLVPEFLQSIATTFNLLTLCNGHQYGCCFHKDVAMREDKRDVVACICAVAATGQKGSECCLYESA